MKYLTPECREPNKFKKCAEQQFKNHYKYSGDVEYTTELGISKNHDYSKYKGSKILVVGGGPSTRDCHWDPNDYDYIFSCNHFFLAQKLQGVHVDFAAICPEVDVRSEAFTNYLNNSSALFCIENPDVPLDNVNYLMSTGRLSLVSLRVNLKLGTTGKLLIVASHFKPARIDVVGFDGVPKNGSSAGDDSGHAFQPGKKFFRTYTYDRCLQELKFTWDYVKNISKDTKFKNLGHGHPYNASTELNIL